MDGVFLTSWLFLIGLLMDGQRLIISIIPACTHTEESNSPWLVIDLQGNYGITHVKILNRGDCCGK